MIEFRSEQEKQYFTDLLCSDGESIDDYSYLFDFREPIEKRVEFNKKRKKILEYLLEVEGTDCILHFENCDLSYGYNVDHIIPLSSNVINKHIHKIPAEKGKKVKTASYGSNDIYNFGITCKKCNNHKMHRFLTKEEMREILDNKERIHGGKHTSIDEL